MKAISYMASHPSAANDDTSGAPTLVLVTGGAGFIGSHIVDRLLDLGYRVRVLDNLSTGRLSNLSAASQRAGYEFVQGDITDWECVTAACDGVQLICHQAALGSVPKSIVNPLATHAANVNGFLNVLCAAKERGIRRVVYASSSSVYGDDSDLPKREAKIGQPLSPYAVTKRVDELYAGVFSQLYGLECVGLRYFNVFGPRQDPSGPYAAVIPRFLQDISDGRGATINGDGHYTRDFTYVENVVEANVLALTAKDQKVSGAVYNIGAGGRVSLNQLHQAIATALGSPLEPRYAATRAGDIPHSNASIEKASRELGYRVSVPFEEGVRRTAAAWAEQSGKPRPPRQNVL